ncbi:helix-turn-helix transcriptional regulator [Kitasatospora griseola]|uniref:helix-turn-helix transcriptional regulator n=1 Tax=Kitasatospora griseola TaxID=2064 RepID=UPI00342F04E1
MPRKDLRNLTDGEKKLAAQIAAGLSARDIAHAPGPPSNTEAARQAIQNLLFKVGARTGAQLAGWTAAAGLITAPHDTPAPATLPELPPRFLEILQGWTDGLTTTAIAERLDVSQRSMDDYVRTLFVHLGVSAPAPAVVVGVLNKCVRPTATP